MNDISIVIVNYNVKHFLDQCLRSVREAASGLSVEIWVVDNDSIDGSAEHIKRHFPEVKLIINQANVGFARANNQAIRQSDGKYILLLNPDTIIEKDTLSLCFDFMERETNCGALGVKMIDGEGKFLPESKRGFPTPTTALLRLAGISRLFPRSPWFNRYNLGYLSEDDTNDIDVLCGAFMFIRKEALDRVGLLDENFFMYGEDIDLSYRIQQAGYRIVYYPASTIIHFKGESTKKSSIKYYHTFYRAMAIFARKHYGGKGINPFLWLIHAAIYSVGVIDYFWKNLISWLLPVLEFFLFFGMLELLEYLWATFYYQDPAYYAAIDSRPVYLVYSLIWLGGMWSGGSYRSLFNLKRYIWGVAGGTVLILVLYALMDNSLRHSRAIIVLAAAANMIVGLPIRHLFTGLIRLGARRRTSDHLKRVIVVGDAKAVQRARDIMGSGSSSQEFVGALALKDQDVDGDIFIQSLDKIWQVIEVYRIDEVLFSADSLSISEIMEWMTRLGSRVQIKIISRDVQSIIGSHDRNSRGDLYTVDMVYRISDPYHRTMKFLLDYLVVLVILPFSPFIALFFKNPALFSSIGKVITRRSSWVSYFREDERLEDLPRLLPGIIPPVALKARRELMQEEMHQINFYYARDYAAIRDLEIILGNLSGLFRNKAL